MNLYQEALNEYQEALKLGQKEYKELHAAGRNPYPAVLDELLPPELATTCKDIGVLEIPVNRIVGVKSAGRIHAFSASFYPLLGEDTEFALKWVNLCADHLGDVGIREPILCYEYMGLFYVQEGNKRLSVLRSFGAPNIISQVRRIMPKASDEPHVRAYFEFLDFYKTAKMYDVRFRRPGDYAKLLSALGKAPGDSWTQEERRTLSSYLHYFWEAYAAKGGRELPLWPEEALLLWLQVYPYRDLGRMTDQELRQSLEVLWPDLVAAAAKSAIHVETTPTEAKKLDLITRLIAHTPDHLKVAFVHQLDTASNWVQDHEEGRLYLEKALPGRVTTCSYFNAQGQNTQRVLEQAAEDGAQVVFATSPQMNRAALRAAVKHPRVTFVNCAVDSPLSRVRTYYGRLYEAKFIAGAVAGAMADDNRIGYVSNYPILGEPASINAFAMGAQLVNPRATVELRWSCLPGDPVAELMDAGVRVMSSRAVPSLDPMYLQTGKYGTFALEENGEAQPLVSPVWVWGKFYERMIRSMLEGTWDNGNPATHNYWWGMDTGVVNVELSPQLPEGVRVLAETLQGALQQGLIDPFSRKIVAQDGAVKNNRAGFFSPEEILQMDWLCANVVGKIPEFEDVLPMSRDVVRALGIHRDQIPPEREAETQ